MKDKCLYSCDSLSNGNEEAKMAKYFPKKVYLVMFVLGIIVSLLLSFVFLLLSKFSLFSFISSFLIILIIFMVSNIIRFDNFVKQLFQKLEEENINLEFYDEYLTLNKEEKSVKFDYPEFDRSIETDTNFYLSNSKKHIIVNIQKDNCSFELTNFIREKFPNMENHIGDQYKFKGIKHKEKKVKTIKILMFILFIITLLSLWGAFWSSDLYNKSHVIQGINFNKNNWIFLCWLPIPIISFILGFIYTNKGLKCYLNMIAGLLVGIVMFAYGSLGTFGKPTYDYSRINEYRSFIDAKLPSNGKIEISNAIKLNDVDKNNFFMLEANYENQDVSELENSIKNSKNWILGKDIDSELKKLIPSNLTIEENAYYSIYNKSTHEYNKSLSESGNYEMCVMKYNVLSKTLELWNFVFKN